MSEEQVSHQPEKKPFDPREHLMQIKNRNGSADYLPVQYRIVWFREKCPEGTIETEMLHLDLDRETEEEGYAWNQETRRSEKVTKHANGLAVFRALVKDGKGGCATGTKSEKAASFPDYIEKAETGSIGRALAALGYGTQFAPDLDEQHRIVDAPVETPSVPQQQQQQNMQPVGSDLAPKVKQLEDLRILCRHLGKQIAKPKTYAEAEKLLVDLTNEYNEMIAKGRAS